MKLLGLFFLVFCSPLAAQEAAKNNQTGEAKAREVIKAAIQAMGGEAYLNVQNSHSIGRQFVFGKEGQKGFAKFWDWTVYEPIKSRNQSNEGKRQEVEIVNLELRQGWHLSGKDTVEAMTEEQIKNWEEGLKHELNLLLKKRVDEEGMHRYYYASDEIAGSGEYEAVDFLDSTNTSVVVFFDRNTHLPARLETEMTDKFGIRHKQEQEFLNWHTIQGVHTPLRIDYFSDGKVSAQIFLETISYNVPIPPEHFLEPKIEKKK